MPVGIGLGTAAVGLGGSMLSASSTKKAARQASDAQVTMGRETNALAQNIYNRNTSNFTPFMQSGTRANALLDNLLYGYQQPQQGAPQGAGGQFQQGGYGGAFSVPNNMSGGGMYDEMQGGYGEPQPGQGMQVPGAVTTQAPNAQNAWDTFRNSTNYQFRFGEGQNALNSGWAGMGALQSGAAMKDAIRYGQNFASNELGNWVNMLQGQQALGAGSASSLAGVGNDFLSSVTATNRNSADAISNAALLRGQANQNFYGQAANALGGFASSFGKPY